MHYRQLSIVIPCLNDERVLAASLAALQAMRARGVEVIVVDGGSVDASPRIAASLADRALTAPRGRALQMNAGAAAATGRVVLFLHADCELPAMADRCIVDALAASGREWGRFDVTLTGAHRALAMVAALMNARSRLTGIATGDQGIFVERTQFERVGGYPPIPLMEDVALSRLLKQHGAPLCLRAKIRASGRRWERDGVLRTIWLMWRLRFVFFAGGDPARLAARYYGVPRE